MANALAGLYDGAQLSRSFQDTFDNSRLNRLAGEAYSAPRDQRQSILGQMASINPRAAQAQQQQFQADEDRQTKLLVNGARYMKGALDSKNPSAVAGAWRTVRPSLIRAGLATEQELSPEWDPSYEQTVHQVLAMGGPETAAYNQNKVIGDALVGPDGNVLYQAERQPEYMWSDRAGAWIPNPNNALLVQRQGSPQGTPANPLEQGGTQAQVDADAALANQMIAAGIPEAQVDAFLAARMNPNAGQSSAAATGGLEPVRVAGIGPKPEISAAEQIRLSMAQRAADRADTAAAEAAAARREAADQRQQAQEEKRQKAEMAAQQAISSVTDSLGTIQRLRSHPGYRQLGTVMGDAALSTPLVRTDAKGANALLETIKSQMLINTLQSLKAASSTGASGFGSLTEREGDALRAAIANLTTAQSHEDLDAAIGQVENVLKRSQQQLSASSPRQAAPDRPWSNAIPQRARNPQTGEVLELRNGQWVPAR